MPQISKEKKESLQKLYESLYNDPRILRMKQFSQHRGSSAYEHTLKVVKQSYKRALVNKREINFEDLILGAMLHDYCLYDWRVEHNLRGHARRHPRVAALNALRDFDVNERVHNIILSHMYPYNPKIRHSSLESKIVAHADKYVSFKEGLTFKDWKNRRRPKYFPKLLKLED